MPDQQGSHYQEANPQITVETFHNPDVIEQRFYEVFPKDKLGLAMGILSRFKPESSLIFCNTKDACRRVGTQLNDFGFHALTLHGDLEQKERTEILIRFTNGSSRILVATDVAARGLDIDSLGAVINFDLPFETETYVHRIGRTGRAGKEGLAFSLVHPKEKFRLDFINDHLESDYSVEASEPELIRSDFDMGSEMQPEMVTLSVNGGRKNKISAGDLLGALTSKGGIDSGDVGRIDRLDAVTFVAVKRSSQYPAVRVLENGLIKGRRFKVMIRDA